ncbi:MAG: aminopeptidase N [Propionibacteriales bacterium]|nr:aminopeptidase N [Propionibacteriales bacterium]
MPGTNLTRAEARTRAELLTVDSYDVALDLTTGEKTFASTTTIRFTCAVPGSSTFVDLVDATIGEITLNGITVDPAVAYVDSRIQLDGLHVENELVVRADCTYSRSGEGLHRFVDPADDRVYLYTQFEVPDARRVYPTFEQPDLKSVFTFHVTAPDHWKVVSNAATPEPEALGGGRATWHFPTTVRMSTYFTALVAGEYHEVRDVYEGAHGAIPLGFFARQSKIADFDTDDLAEITKQGFAFFEDAFGYPYPFGKYDQLFVPEYNMGAMENAGCVTFRDEYLPRSRQTQAFYEQRANTILHEMAHMWFGDLVTMRWWDDLWLNESFAEWAAHHASVKATRFTEAWTGFTNARKNWAYRADQLPSTHPIAADNYDLEAVEGNFDGITYAKGASSLKQLVAWVGEEPFLQGLSAYFHQHAFDNAQFGDLLAALTEASGRELDGWATEWLTTSGVNTLSADFDVDGNGAFTRFAVQQTALAEFPTIRRHRIRVGLYDSVDGRLVRRTFVETDIAGESTEISELVGQAQPDLVLLNDGDLTYAKIRLDERSLATLVSSIATLDDSLARALCWGAAWDMTRDAELAAGDFVKLVLAGVGSESDITAVQALLTYARSSADSYSAPSKRAALRATWEAGVRGLLEAAEAGSDHQLAFARSFAAAAHTEAALDLVQGLYDGTASLDGLEVNQDLRWSFLQALAAGGRVDEPAIDAELARDNTISGQEKAAGARTVRPTAEAKAWAWEAAVLGNDLPNETMRQVCASFQVAGQEELLAPYVAKYLEVAETVIETKGVWIARVNLELTFPRAIPTQATLDAVTAWLESTQANPAAVRYVREGQADLARALAAQAKDAE